MKTTPAPQNLAHLGPFKIWMANDGYAVQTQKEYPYFLRRYCGAFRRAIDESTLASEAHVAAIYAEVERAINQGGRRAREFNIYDLKRNLRPAMRAYVRFIAAEFRQQVANDVPIDDLPKRLKTTVSRLIRDTRTARQVKAVHQHFCQLCRNRLELSPGFFYSEAHHIKPLGKKHNGPDVMDNILCVCPNCHVKLDFAAVKIHGATLRQAKGHTVRQEFIAYHNQLCELNRTSTL